MRNLCIILVLFSFNAFTQTVEERLVELENRLDSMVLEKQSNKWSFSGVFIQQFHHLEETKIEAGSKTHERVTPFSMLVGLNVNYAFNANLKFYSTLAMSKFWNNDNRAKEDQDHSYQSMQGSYGYGGSQAYFNRAFIQYNVESIHTNFVIGRMPTNDGPPANQLDGLSRYGTYPRYGYNVILDGVAAIHNFKRFMPEKWSFKMRFFYTPYSQLNDIDRNRQETTAGSAEKIASRSDQFAILNELEIEDIFFSKRFDFYYMYWNYEKFFDRNYQDATDSDVEYYRANSHVFYLGLNDFMTEGLNLTLSSLLVDSQLQGDTKHLSESYLMGANYKLKGKSVEGHVIGFENINSDQNYYLEDQNYIYIADFYIRAKNKGQHYFYTIPIASAQTLRFGLFDYKAGNAPVNNQDWKSDVTSFYVNWKVLME